MTTLNEARQAIHARIIELLTSGPVPEADLPAAVAISPEEREEVDRWRLEVRGVADVMCANGEIMRKDEGGEAVYHLPKDG